MHPHPLLDRHPRRTQQCGGVKVASSGCAASYWAAHPLFAENPAKRKSDFRLAGKLEFTEQTAFPSGEGGTAKGRDERGTVQTLSSYRLGRIRISQEENINLRVYEFAEIVRNKQPLPSLFSLGFAEPASPEGKPLLCKPQFVRPLWHMRNHPLGFGPRG